MHENPYASSELLPPGPVDLRQRKWRFRYWIGAGVIALAVLALALPLMTVAVWDGRFELKIHVNSDPAIDLDSVRFVTCWRQADATYVLSQADERFGGAWSIASRDVARKNWSINVPCSGRSHWIGIGDTYAESSILVVEYKSIASGEHSKHRKQFLIPKGRGARSTTIILP